MAKSRSGDTREKVLATASDVFFEKGFRDATVAEICGRAGANISAVNYHFGTKEALYKEAWRHAFAESIKKYPQDGGVGVKASAKERLRGQVKALIARIADEDNRDFFISQMEFINPTGLLREVIASEMIPLREKTLALVRELLGAKASEQLVMFCEICIISMCIHPVMMKRVREKTKDIQGPVVIDDFEAYADHVVEFVLAGIQALRRYM